MKFKCELCKFFSKTKNGIQVHINVSHKSLHNEKLKEKKKNFNWTKREFEYLARTVIEIKKNKVRIVSKAVGEKLGRSEQAIQKIQTGTDYKRAERKVQEEIAQKQIYEEAEEEGEVEAIEK